MSYEPDPRVDAYIDALRTGSRPSVARCATSCTPPTRRSARPSSATSSPTSSSRATSARSWQPRDHVNVFLYDGAIVPDPDGIITGGHDNQTARTVAIYEKEPVNATALKAISSRSSPTTARAAGARSRPSAATKGEC